MGKVGRGRERACNRTLGGVKYRQDRRGRASVAGNTISRWASGPRTSLRLALLWRSNQGDAPFGPRDRARCARF